MKKLLKIGVCLLALLLLSVTATAAAADPEYVQVYCAAERYWEGCQVHWLGSRMPCNWPGKDMARVTDGSWNRVWCDDAPGEDPGVETMTLDLYYSADVTVIFDPVRETVWAEISYAVPEGDTVYRVTGNAPFMGNWDPSCHGCVMEEESPGVYEKLFTGVQPGEYDFMITKNGTWHDAVGQDGDNIHFTVSCVSDILVRFDSRSRQVTVHDVSIVPQSTAHTPPFSITHVAELYNRLQNGIRTPEASALDYNRDGKLNILDVVSMYTQVRRGTAQYEA